MTATPPTAAREILRVQGLSAGYGPLTVLHDLDFSVVPGERVAIVGLNGHGKSTLFRAISGLTGWQRGSILLQGQEIGGTRTTGPGRHTHKIVRLGLAHMPQGDAIFPGLTVAQHLDCGAYTRAAWGRRHQRREQLLEIFPPLRQLLKSPVGTLSGGERRMVSLARGLMADAVLYLVDEPSLGLAPIVSRAVIDALLQIDLRDGAMVIAEQNLALLSGHCHRTLGMHAGQLKGSH
ncbi:ABC transporter ATP-binding protein [Ideonella sp. A 288]|uniref:ABC transporter ATP-binding protein n=1 Tax=Ideonella sp. A 288 TaxID=1962181 RepID=UPI000B4BAE98|nr:ATP-binding cassette domain-containing protein [Ideonella sp. A 288]